jgi:acetylglutamate kinase
VLEDVVWLKKLGVNPVVVHGGGPQLTRMLGQLGVETHFVEGRRYTDERTMEVAHMVFMRLNGQFVSYLDARGVPAVGLSGLDGRLLQARIRDPQLGLVGEVDHVNLAPIQALVQAGYVVVIAPIACGPSSQPLNVNADTVAGEVARALGAETFILFTDVPGVMDASGTVLSRLERAQVDALIREGTIKGGMLPKVESCLRALETVPRVHILDGRTPRALLRALFTATGAGTLLAHADEAKGAR